MLSNTEIAAGTTLHVPVELREAVAEVWGKFILRTTTPEAYAYFGDSNVTRKQQRRREMAAHQATLAIREHLGLAPQQELAACSPVHYQLRDANRQLLRGALVLRCQVGEPTAEGLTLIRRDIWINDEHPQLAEPTRAFTGAIADAKAARGDIWAARINDTVDGLRARGWQLTPETDRPARVVPLELQDAEIIDWPTPTADLHAA